MPETDLNATSLATEGEPTGNDQSASGNQNQATEATGAEEGLKLEGFPEEERSKLARFKSHNELAKSYLELEKRLGATVQLPGKNASSEERAAFFKRLGRPESAADYELETVYLPDGATKVDLGDEAFRAAALEANLTKEQAKVLHKFAAQGALKMIGDWQAKIKAAREAAETALRTEYGTEYAAKKATIPAAYQKYDRKDDLIQWLNEGPGNDPRVVRYLVWVGNQFTGDGRPVRGRPVSVEERKEGQLSYDEVAPELATRR